VKRRGTRPLALAGASALALGVAIAAAASPGSPVRAGGLEHGDAGSIAFVSALALAFALYVAALLVLRRSPVRLRWVCAVAIVIQLLPLAGPLLLSRDVYSYWAYARIAAQHEKDPYVASPSLYAHDPATRAVARGWRGTTSVYGPGFTAASVAVDRLAGSSSETEALFFRATAALAAVAATLLAAGIARRKAFAGAFVGWNPLLAVSFAGGGHNDAWMLVLMLAAVALALRRRDFAAGGVWVLAAAVKVPALLVFGLELVRSRRAAWLGAAAAAAVVSITATAAFGTAWLSTLVAIGSRESKFALPVRLEQIGVPDRVAHALAIVALVGVGAWLLRLARRGRPRLALGACLLVLTSPWLLPWYATWPVALAAVEEDALAQVLALSVAAYLLPARIPF
jgi:glycosyl transferase family 87